MPDRSLGEWLGYLEQVHPAEIELGLTRVRLVAQSLDLLPYPLTVLTVAGTNGKGSVVYSAEAIVRAAGRRTGLYTSPHILRYNERIAVDGAPVDDATIIDAFETIESARGTTTLTYFEFATLAALWIFRRLRVDVAVLEVGLGGRLDAVNIVDCDIAVITAIDIDHQQWLGDTVEKIAPEKAAVARAGRPVILAEPQYPESLFRTLRDIGARALRAGDHWSWRAENNGADLALSFPGSTMPSVFPVPAGLRPGNVAAALQACHQLLGPDFDPAATTASLRQLQVPGRRQRVLLEGRELLFDVAHNPAAMAALAEYLLVHPISGQTFAALGVMADKDLVPMAAHLATAVDGACALAIPGIDRAQSPEVIWQILDDAGVAIPQAEFTSETVWRQLRERSHEGDRIVICGSFHSVAGIMAELKLELPVTTSRAGHTRG